MDWYLPISDFKNGSETIVVDVNGSELPNELGTDRFEYKVKPGLKVEVEEPTFYAPTGAPPSKPAQEAAPNGSDKDNRTAQNVYSIVCGGGGATIYGEGPNKVNGTYTLVAVPNKGYKCNWFIHQVTVKDSDVTDCNLSCSPDNNIPTSDGETIVPDPVPDEPVKPDKTYCINVTVTGESDQCTVSGAGCGKKKGLYPVTVSSKDPANYAPGWSSKNVTIVDSDVNETVSCDPIDPGEACYNITVKGSAEEKANCPVTLPAGNCPENGEGGDYLSGTHKVVVTPKEGYLFNYSAEASDVTVLISEADGVVDLTGKCKSSNIEPTIEISIAGPSFKPDNTDCGSSEVTVNGDAVFVTAKCDGWLESFWVRPSDKEKPWRLNESGEGAWSLSLTNGTGLTEFNIGVSYDTLTNNCVQAEYTDGSAESNKVCVRANNTVSPSQNQKLTINWKGTNCSYFGGTVNLEAFGVTESADQSFNFGERDKSNGSKTYDLLFGEFKVSASGISATDKNGNKAEVKNLKVEPAELLRTTSDKIVSVSAECEDAPVEKTQVTVSWDSDCDAVKGTVTLSGTNKYSIDYGKEKASGSVTQEVAAGKYTLIKSIEVRKKESLNDDDWGLPNSASMSSSTSITIAEGETGKISIKAVCGEAKPASDPNCSAKEQNVTLSVSGGNDIPNTLKVKFTVVNTDDNETLYEGFITIGDSKKFIVPPCKHYDVRSGSIYDADGNQIEGFHHNLEGIEHFYDEDYTLDLEIIQ